MDHPVLRRGDSGLAVKRLQSLLRAEGQTVNVDGLFGVATEAAVRAFQTATHLTVDGIVGPKTWAALEAAVGQQEESAEAGEMLVADTITINKTDWNTIKASYATVASILRQYRIIRCSRQVFTQQAKF